MQNKQRTHWFTNLSNLVLGLSIFIVLYRFIFPGYSWVHPHYYYDILPQSLANGSNIKFRDLIDIFQPRQDFEVRSRFMNYLLLSMDQKIRIFIYGKFYIPSNFLPIISTLNILSVLLFYKVLKFLFKNSNIAKIGISFYLVSIGFYSISGNVYMAAKPVTNFIIILSMYLTTRFITSMDTKMKYLTLNSIVVFIGFYTDEVAFLVLLNYFVLTGILHLRIKQNRNLEKVKLPPQIKKKNDEEIPLFSKAQFIFASYFVALISWAISITILVPIITKKFFNWNFLFWQFNLNLKNDINFGGGFPENTQVDLLFILKNIISNIFHIFTYQFIPEFLFSIRDRADLAYGQPNSLYRYGYLSSLGILMLIVFLIFIVYLLIKDKSRELSLLLLTLTISIIFFTLLQLKHVPQISGYIYGASISIFAVMFLSGIINQLNLKKSLGIQQYIMIVGIVLIQFLNGNEFNNRWDLFHRNWSKSAIEQINSLPTSTLGLGIKTETDISPRIFEDFKIWKAFHDNTLDQYLFTNSVSLKSMAFIVELRLGTYAKELNNGKYNCDIAGLQLACIGYKNK